MQNRLNNFPFNIFLFRFSFLLIICSQFPSFFFGVIHTFASQQTDGKTARVYCKDTERVKRSEKKRRLAKQFNFFFFMYNSRTSNATELKMISYCLDDIPKACIESWFFTLNALIYSRKERSQLSFIFAAVIFFLLSFLLPISLCFGFFTCVFLVHSSFF